MRICAKGPIAGLANLGNAVGVNRGVARATLVVVATGLVTIGLLASSAFATSRSAEQSLPTLNQRVFAAINSSARRMVSLRCSESKELDQVCARALAPDGPRRASSATTRPMERSSACGSGATTARRATRTGRWGRTSSGTLRPSPPPPPCSSGSRARRISRISRRRSGATSASQRSPSRGAGGLYGGRRVTIITTDFGVRAGSPPSGCCVGGRRRSA